jgi:Domain of unknown function (DUF6950)
MADVSEALSDYLASLRGRRWQIGALDCGVFMADWVLRLTGRDPIADVRGRYRSQHQLLAILRREGGFERSCAKRLAAVGFVATDQPGAGDIVAVLAPYAMRRGKLQRRPAGGICVAADLTAVVTSDIGVVIAGRQRLPRLGAWTCDHG